MKDTQLVLINHQGLKTVSGIQIQTPSPPIGLAYLGAFLKQNSKSYVAIDACGEALDNINRYKDNANIMVQGLSVKEVVKKTPDRVSIFGVTCLFSHSWPLVLDIVSALRPLYPDSLFVAGGEHTTALPKETLACGLIDISVNGEGEETFLEIIKAVEENTDWREIDGLSYLDEDGNLIRNSARKRVTEIDNFPYPDWDSWSIENYIEHNQVTGINLGRSLPILGSRGCPYACTFCSSPDMWTRRYIFRDSNKLVDEMAFFQKKYNVDGFTFQDLTFVVNRKKVLKFSEELIKRNLNVTYQLPAGTRCEALDQELCDSLAKSGLRNFALAPESGDPRILKIIRKQIDPSQFLKAVQNILRTDMTLGCFFVIGFPEDDRQSMKNSLRLIRRLAFLGVHDVTVSQFTPYPGSVYFNRLVAEKKVSKDFDRFSQMIDFYSPDSQSYCDKLTARQLYKWMLWMYLNFYVIGIALRPWRLGYNLWVYWTTGIERTRYMRFFHEIWTLRGKWKSKRAAVH
jgi:anaerobic magnesium-protoporphyrin IX monomethyl ester cyclase